MLYLKSLYLILTVPLYLPTSFQKYIFHLFPFLQNKFNKKWGFCQIKIAFPNSLAFIPSGSGSPTGKS